MASLFRKFTWWLERRRKEDELREELQFHLAEEAGERQADGLSEDQARWAARRDLGNVTLLQEDTRSLWSWVLLEQLAQDVRYGLRTMFKNRVFTALAALSLALGIGANTAIYSFMDSILLRSLPVSDPASLVVVKWRSRPVNFSDGNEFVLHSIDGHTYRDRSGITAAIFPFPAFERLQEASAPVLSSIFAYHPAGNVNVRIRGEADLARGQYVSGDFFRGLAVLPAAGRVIVADDDRAGAQPVVVLSMGYSQRRFGGAAGGGRSADPDQQRRVHRDRRDAGRVLWRGSRRGARRLSSVAGQPSLRPKCRERICGPELLLAADHGTAASRRWPRAGRGCARHAVRAVGDADRHKRSGARQSSRTLARRRRGWTRQPQTAVFEAALRAFDDGRPDSGDCVREHGESAARPSRRPQARDGRAAEHRRGPVPPDSSTADGERPARLTERRARHPHRRRRHPCADDVAGQRAGGVHAARRTELARARRHAGAVAAVRRAVRPGSRDSIDAAGADAGAQGSVRQRAAIPAAWQNPAPEPDAGAGRGADRDRAAAAGRGGSLRAHALESPFDFAGVQSRQRAAVRVERSAGRLSGGQGRRLL